MILSIVSSLSASAPLPVDIDVLKVPQACSNRELTSNSQG